MALSRYSGGKFMLGRKPIADLFLANGSELNIFEAAATGQL